MELSLLEYNRKKIRHYGLISLCFHCALFLILLLGNFIFPTKRDLLLPTIQVDMVALPSQTKKSEQNFDTALPIKEENPPEESSLVIKKEVKIDASKAAKSALAKLKEEVELSRKEKNKQDKNKKKLDLQRFEAAYRSAISGNQTNNGDSANGILAETRNAYFGHLASRLRGNWSLPAWLQSKGLRASVVIYVSGSGEIARFRFLKESGNDVFDDYVKATLQRSSPFAPPPTEMSKDLRNTGIEVNFPL